MIKNILAFIGVCIGILMIEWMLIDLLLKDIRKGVLKCLGLYMILMMA